MSTCSSDWSSVNKYTVKSDDELDGRPSALGEPDDSTNKVEEWVKSSLTLNPAKVEKPIPKKVEVVLESESDSPGCSDSEVEQPRVVIRNVSKRRTNNESKITDDLESTSSGSRVTTYEFLDTDSEADVGINNRIPKNKSNTQKKIYTQTQSYQPIEQKTEKVECKSTIRGSVSSNTSYRRMKSLPVERPGSPDSSEEDESDLGELSEANSTNCELEAKTKAKTYTGTRNSSEEYRGRGSKADSGGDVVYAFKQRGDEVDFVSRNRKDENVDESWDHEEQERRPRRNENTGASRSSGRGGRGSRGRGRGGRGRGRGGRGGVRRDGNGDNDGKVEQIIDTGYIPPPFLEGEAKFKEHLEIHSHSGINFDKYENIPVKVEGKNTPAPSELFKDFGLAPLLIESVDRLNYKKPTPIQKHAIPILLAGRDVLACAENGSGKTAAFLLPVLNTLLKDEDNLTPNKTFPATPEALILTPTRELAIQIGKEAHVYASDSLIKTLVMYGGTSLYDTREKILDHGVNVLVTTPGRLRQFLGDEQVVLDKIKFFILDEADRMLDLGFADDIKAIGSVLPAKNARVTGMFSATFPTEIRDMAADLLNNRIFVSVGIVGGACQDIIQEFCLVDSNLNLNAFHERVDKLVELAETTGQDEKILVFCSTRVRTDILTATLCSRLVSSTSIHGDRLQRQRETALDEFRSGKRKILVTTPVSARGIDIPVVAIVVNFDLPTSNDEHYYQFGNYHGDYKYVVDKDSNEMKDHPLRALGRHHEYWVKKAIDEYVHRIGRTGRVGNRGRAISFFDVALHKNLAKGFVQSLEDSNQPVPEWMLKIAESLGTIDTTRSTSLEGDSPDVVVEFVSRNIAPTKVDDDDEWL